MLRWIRIVLHLLAEVSNPCIIIRTILKIKGMRDSSFYKYNELVFAFLFLTLRMFVTPFLLVYMFEGDRIIYANKLGICFILYQEVKVHNAILGGESESRYWLVTQSITVDSRGS